MKMKHPPVSSLTLNFSSVCNLLTLCNKIILKFYCLKGFHNRCKVSVVKFEKKNLLCHSTLLELINIPLLFTKTFSRFTDFLRTT